MVKNIFKSLYKIVPRFFSVTAKVVYKNKTVLKMSFPAWPTSCANPSKMARIFHIFIEKDTEVFIVKK